jgi:hypothetical protein
MEEQVAWNKGKVFGDWSFIFRVQDGSRNQKKSGIKQTQNAHQVDVNSL